MATINVVVDEYGNKLEQGTLFPRHLKASDLRFIGQLVISSWAYDNEERAKIVDTYQRRDGTHWVVAKLTPSYGGVKEVGAFILGCQLLSLWPVKSQSNSYLKYEGQKVKKTKRRLSE